MGFTRIIFFFGLSNSIIHNLLLQNIHQQVISEIRHFLTSQPVYMFMKSRLDRGRFQVDLYRVGAGGPCYLNETRGRVHVAGSAD